MCSATGQNRANAPFASPWRLAVLAVCTACAFVLALASHPACAHAETEYFALLADTHLGQPYQTSYEETEEALYWASDFDNLKAVCVAGDLTDRGDPEAYSEWEFLCDSILDEAVHIQALGDHDTGKNGEYLKVDSSLTVANGANYFKEVNGGALTSYTEFGNANVMTVGGIRARGHSVITKSMLQQLNSRLAKTVRQGKMAIVICHYPYGASELNMRAKLMGILRSYPNVIYVSGHKHRYSTSAQCKAVAPRCTTTPYSRAGFSKSTKFKFRSIGVNACSAYRSGNGRSYADMLAIADSGKVTVSKWNLTKGSVDRKWAFNQTKSSVTVKCSPKGKRYPKKDALTYRVVFSNGGTYGGVKSGSTFTLMPGKSRKFSGIPAGVLVTVKPVKVPAGWSKGQTSSVEVGSKAKSIAMKPSYSAVAASSGSAKLRAA